MLIRGSWIADKDGVVRPLLVGEVSDPHGRGVEVVFLVDTGADQTVISADYYADLVPDDAEAMRNLLGVGGELPAAVVPTVLRFLTTDGRRVKINGSFAVFASVDGLGMSVLGRDVLSQFAVIVDYKRDFVGLLGGNHRYVIQEP